MGIFQALAIIALLIFSMSGLALAAEPPEPTPVSLVGKVQVISETTPSDTALVVFALLMQGAIVYAAFYFGRKNEKMHQTAADQIAEMQAQNAIAQEQLAIMRSQHNLSIAPLLVSEKLTKYSTEHDTRLKLTLKNYTSNLANEVFGIAKLGNQYFMSDRSEIVGANAEVLHFLHITPLEAIKRSMPPRFSPFDMLVGQAPAHCMLEESFNGLCILYVDLENNAHMTLLTGLLAIDRNESRILLEQRTQTFHRFFMTSQNPTPSEAPC